MSHKYQSKYLKIDDKHPEAMGMCDYSGFMFNHKDLRKQMEWRGDALVWTGMMVGVPFLDKPNEQNRPFKSKKDPKTVENPRPADGRNDPYSNTVLPYKEALIVMRRLRFNE